MEAAMNYANDNHHTDPITFFSVCSGIEAASVAWNPLGWKCVGVSEIEKFPSAVLAHHYPDVRNHGDFTKVDVSTLPRVDILCGGTPCQAFSVAGLRRSLDDERGNLSLSFVRLAHELADRNGLRNVVWENVPGVLSTKDNAFGCFLGALVGADDAVPPPGGGRKWPSHGMVSGPKGRAAWAIKDAQYFGVPQRRRRVVVVADFGNGADPATVLFELYGVQGNTPPRREARKDVAPTISARTKSGGGLGTDFDLDGGLVTSTGDTAHCLNAGGMGRQDYETETNDRARCHRHSGAGGKREPGQWPARQGLSGRHSVHAGGPEQGSGCLQPNGQSVASPRASASACRAFRTTTPTSRGAASRTRRTARATRRSATVGQFPCLSG